MQPAAVLEINSRAILGDAPMLSLWSKRRQLALWPLFTLENLWVLYKLATVATILASTIPNPDQVPLVLWLFLLLQRSLSTSPPTSFRKPSHIQRKDLILPNTAGWGHSVWSGTWGFSSMVSDVWRRGPDPMVTESSRLALLVPHSAMSMAGTHSWFFDYLTC